MWLFRLLQTTLMAMTFVEAQTRRQCTTLQHGWRFALQRYPIGCPEHISEHCSEGSSPDLAQPADDAGACSVPACQPRFNDTGWLLRSVPHDMSTEHAPSIEEAAETTRVWDWAHARSHTDAKKRYVKFLSLAAARHLAEMKGSLPPAQGWYRRSLSLPPAADAWLEFDGAMVASVVFADGQRIGEHRGGYLPFSFRLHRSEGSAGVDAGARQNSGEAAPMTTATTTPMTATTTTTSVQLAVFVDMDSSSPSPTWWADGAGLVRHVRLCHSASLLRIATPPLGDGVKLSTQLLRESDEALRMRLSQMESAALHTADAIIISEVPIQNAPMHAPAWFRVRTRLSHLGRVHGHIRRPLASADRVIFENVSSPLRLQPGASIVLSQSVTIPSAALWSVDAPHLYSCTITVLKAEPPHQHAGLSANGDAVDEDLVLDEVSHRIGVRRITWDQGEGALLINGMRVILHGVANHDDFAGVGTAIPDALQW